MKKNIHFFYLIIILFISGLLPAQTCHQLKNNTQQLKGMSNGVQTQASNIRSDTVDIINYNISLNITDFTNKIISGNTAVKFTPVIGGVTKLDLDLLELTIDSVEVLGNNLTYIYNDTLLSIDLPQTYNVNDTAIVVVYYHGTPQGDPANWGGFYFDATYAYNLGVGFGANPHVYGRVWFPCFDNFVERSSYEFNITSNNGKTSYCNGYLANDTTDINGNRTRKWIMEEQIPSYLASVAVAGYTEINQSFNGVNDVIPVIIAAMASDTANIKNSFVNLNLAFSTFENRFGPYMWNRVGYCMVPFSSGAMEHATNISYPRLFATGNTTYQSVCAHELSHHWFGDLATCRTQEDMWLNEGWARYSEFIFAEALGGYSSYLNSARVNHEDNLHFNIVKEGNLTMSNIPFAYTYGDHVYNKGADMAHTMRGYMGDSLFFYSVKTYLSQNNYKDVSSIDFKDALSAASGINMNDYFNDWIFNPGWPHFSIDSFSVSPNGGNFNVEVFVKQKLTGAPAYYSNVPLEVTFKAADWTEQTGNIIMSGPNASFNFTLPFDPSFVAVNMGEKISHAVAPEIKKIKATGGYNFTNARMNLNVLSISDSAFIRVEHNYTAPDAFKMQFRPYRLSPNRYWKVDGVLPSNFKAKATIVYDGRNTVFSGSNWLDNDLINTYEDSLVLMYRASVADDWSVFPFYTKNYVGNNNNKFGNISIDSLRLGEYVFAMKDYSMGIQNRPFQDQDDQITVYPNPTKDMLTVDLYGSMIKIPDHATLNITDPAGKLIYKEKISGQKNILNINTSAYSNGLYFISISVKDRVVAKSKFVISH